MLKLFKKLIGDKEGVSAVEYAVLLALISAVIILSIQGLGNTLNATYANMNSAITSSVGGGDGAPGGGSPGGGGGHHGGH